MSASVSDPLEEGLGMGGGGQNSDSMEKFDAWSHWNWTLSSLIDHSRHAPPSLGGFLTDLALYISLMMTPVLLFVLGAKVIVRIHRPFRFYFRLFKTVVEDIFLFVFTGVWLFCVTQPYGWTVLWRYGIGVYMKLRYGSMGDVTTAADSAGSLDYPESRQIIKSVKILRGRCNISQLRERVKKTALKKKPNGTLTHPKFHQWLDLVGGHYVWKPPLFPFDVKNHVRFVDGLDENSPSVSESQMLGIVSSVSNVEFAKGRGLWEILVIPNYHHDHEEDEERREAKFALVVRISHGIGDGFSFLKLVMRDMAGENEEEYVPPSKPSKHSWTTKILIFFYLLSKAGRTFYSEAIVKDLNPMHHPGIKMTGKKIHTWSRPLNIEWLKGLKKELGCGMTSILLNCLGGACRKNMMLQHGMPESQLPKRMLTMIPAAAPNHPNEEMVNKFSIFMMPLSLRKKSSLERCHSVEKEYKAMSMSPTCYVNLFLMDLLAVFGVAATRFLLVNRQCTSVISNLPGPKKDIAIWGYPLEDAMFWLPNVGTSGVSVSYLSYGSKMRMGLAVDTGVVPTKRETELLLRWMIEDLKSLAASVGHPHDDQSMFVQVGPPSSSTPSETSSSQKGRPRDEVEVASSFSSDDCGYEGSISDDADEYSYNNNVLTIEERKCKCKIACKTLTSGDAKSTSSSAKNDSNNNSNSDCPNHSNNNDNGSSLWPHKRKITSTVVGAS